MLRHRFVSVVNIAVAEINDPAVMHRAGYVLLVGGKRHFQTAALK